MEVFLFATLCHSNCAKNLLEALIVFCTAKKINYQMILCTLVLHNIIICLMPKNVYKPPESVFKNTL